MCLTLQLPLVINSSSSWQGEAWQISTGIQPPTAKTSNTVPQTGKAAAEQYARDVTRPAHGLFFLDMSATDVEHARAIIIPRATTQGSPSKPNVLLEMSPSELHRLVVYSAECGPLVSCCSRAVFARRCELVARAAHSMGLRVVAGIYSRRL